MHKVTLLRVSMDAVGLACAQVVHVYFAKLFPLVQLFFLLDKNSQ